MAVPHRIPIICQERKQFIAEKNHYPKKNYSKVTLSLSLLTLHKDK